MTPPRSYLGGDDGLENLKTIVQTFYGATVTINGQIVQSPVHKVTQDESVRWKLIGTKQEAETLIQRAGKMIMMILPTYLVEITRMKPPTIRPDATVASKCAADTQQVSPAIHTLQ